jgi:hypothetical protein
VNRKYRVIAGPYRMAKRYAQSMGWSMDEIVIVSRGHQLASLDPALIASIVTVKLHDLGHRIVAEIQEEINRVKALWPVPTQAVA